MERRTSRWRLWAARLIFGYCAAGIFIVSLPRPHLISNRKRWDTEKTRREFDGWAGGLRVFGIDADHEDVDRVLWPIAQGAAKIITTLRAPYKWTMSRTGFFQSWRMFSTPNTERVARLVVELDQGDGDYQPIYVARSSTYTWRRHQFDHDRMRKLVARGVRPGKGKYFHALGRWIAKTAAQDFPDAARVRVKAEHFILETPEEWIAGKELAVEVRSEKIYELERFR